MCCLPYLTLPYLTKAFRSAELGAGKMVGGMGCFGVRILAIGWSFPVIESETSCGGWGAGGGGI